MEDVVEEMEDVVGEEMECRRPSWVWWGDVVEEMEM